MAIMVKFALLIYDGNGCMGIAKLRSNLKNKYGIWIL